MTTTAPSWLADIFSKLTDYQAWKAMLSKEPWPSVLLAAALLLFIMAPNYMFQVSAADEKRMEEIREQFQKSKFAKDLKLDEKYGQFRRNREVFTPSSNANAAIERSQDYRVKQQAQTSTGSKKDDSRGKQKEASSTSTSVMPSKVSELKNAKPDSDGTRLRASALPKVD
ncbi:unnamed protein product [Amoebophrya sp. A120]|nr:unnamed protein product [Amoebophrya sp. A120]|eukprot:GSA120T00003414001.1